METTWHSVVHKNDVRLQCESCNTQQSILSFNLSWHVHVRGLRFFSTLHLSVSDFEILFWDYSLIERVGE